MASEAQYGSLPFEDAIEFFREKLNVPTKDWEELWKSQHNAAFSSAGALKADLLVDLRAAVDAAIAEGATLAEFRKAFDSAVEKYGWSYKGNRNWRSAIIYDTNVRTAYSAGRWKQQTTPEMLSRRPYMGYRHGNSKVPRELHLKWDRTVLPASDPWWKTHYPPNGWGCKCRVFSLSESDLNRMGKSVDTAPDDGTYEYTDKLGATHTIPKGIDPGWDYNPGITDFKRDFSKYPPELRDYLTK